MGKQSRSRKQTALVKPQKQQPWRAQAMCLVQVHLHEDVSTLIDDYSDVEATRCNRCTIRNCSLETLRCDCQLCATCTAAHRHASGNCMEHAWPCHACGEKPEHVQPVGQCGHNFCLACAPSQESPYVVCAMCVKASKVCPECKERIWPDDCNANCQIDDIETCELCTKQFHWVCEGCPSLDDETRQPVCRECIDEKFTFECPKCQGSYCTLNKYDFNACPDCGTEFCCKCLTNYDSNPERCHECQLQHDCRINKRKGPLVAALQEKGLELRKDSKLCSAYLEGSNRVSLAEVVKRMCQAKLFHEYCEFKLWYDYYEQQNEEEYEAGYYPDVPPHCAAQHDLSCLLDSTGNYPWPWLNGVSVDMFRQSPEYLACKSKIELQISRVQVQDL